MLNVHYLLASGTSHLALVRSRAGRNIWHLLISIVTLTRCRGLLCTDFLSTNVLEISSPTSLDPDWLAGLPGFELLELSVVIFEVFFFHVGLDDKFQVTSQLLLCVHLFYVPIDGFVSGFWLAFVQEDVVVIIELMIIGQQTCT